MKKDKQWEAYKNHIKKVSSGFRYLIFAGEYNLKTQYMDQPKYGEDPESPCAAEISIDPCYLLATITFYPLVYEWYKQKRWDDVARTILHEMCHILTEPLYVFSIPFVSDGTHPFLKDIRERQTQRITNTLFELIKKDDYLPKK